VVSDQPDTFVSPTEPWEDGYDPQRWVTEVADAGRVWYLGTWYLDRDQDPVYSALLSQGWKPREEFDTSGGFLVLMTGGGTSAAGLVDQGIQAMRRGENDAAEAKFEAAIAKSPSDADADYDLGVLYQQHLHDQVLAAQYFSDALRIDASYTPALYDLALTETPSNPTEAIALYNKLVILSPNSADVLWNLGLLLVAQDSSSSQGHADLQKALSLDPRLAAHTPPGVTP
jgi:tetratricopeptide (TPR) repeat protein